MDERRLQLNLTASVMNISELIMELQRAKGLDRALDTAIAAVIGVPAELRYTGSIDDAKRLADIIAPEGSARFAWGNASTRQDR